MAIFMSPTAPDALTPTRRAIAAKVRALRKGRRWTQAELAERLDLSQGHLSELERGDGSFTAEQFLLILSIFNASLSQFAPPGEPDYAAVLQNALARLGALHLRESEHVLPSEQLEDVNQVVREALITGAPRMLSAVAPVLVRNIDKVNLRKLHAQLVDVGLELRLGWLLDNTLEALEAELTSPLSRPWSQLYRRAVVVVQSFMADNNKRPKSRPGQDLLDGQIRTKKTLDEVKASRSPISRQWGIVTTLQPADFATALSSARADH